MDGKELLNALYAPFAPDEHEVRELRKTKNGKIQWSIYIRREAITTRLDNLLPFEWEFKTNEPRREAEYVAVKGSLIIKGQSRDNNGAASAKGFDDEGKAAAPDENTEKAAMTDCFKRCASSWGIGLYLQNAPDIYTDGYTKGDWDAARKREAEAFEKAKQWVRFISGAPEQRVDTETGEITEKPASNGKPAPITPMPETKVGFPVVILNDAYTMVKNAMERATFDVIMGTLELPSNASPQTIAKAVIGAHKAREKKAG